MVPPEIRATVEAYLAAVQAAGVPVSFGVLFGSFASGQPGPLSDIDLLVVSPLFDTDHSWQSRALLWRLAARCDSRIEPVACGDQQWHDDQGTPILEVVRQQGQRIELA